MEQLDTREVDVDGALVSVDCSDSWMCLLDKAAGILEKELSNEEFKSLSEFLDNGHSDALLDSVNERLVKTNPEVFSGYDHDGLARVDNPSLNGGVSERFMQECRNDAIKAAKSAQAACSRK